MRGAVVAVIVTLAGCYSPSPPSGAPCDPASANCPSGQSCVASGGDHVCLRPDEQREPPLDSASIADAPATPEDSGIDANPSDLDGDGVPNTDDNCPTKANTAQFNEDADAYGDACDPCPIYDDPSPALDPDGDGVSNECDPHPITAGDQIALFEGFNQPQLPPTLTTTGNWFLGNGRATVTAAAGVIATMLTTRTTTSSEYVFTRYRALDVNLDVPYAGVGVVTRRGLAQNDGIGCQIIVLPTMATKLYLSNFTSSETKLKEEPFTATLNTPYPVVLGRDGIRYDCNAYDPATDTEAAIDEPVGGTLTTARMGLRVRATNAAFDYLLIITGP